MLFVHLLTELFISFRWSRNHLLVGGLQQSSYAGTPCFQLGNSRGDQKSYINVFSNLLLSILMRATIWKYKNQLFIIFFETFAVSCSGWHIRKQLCWHWSFEMEA